MKTKLYTLIGMFLLSISLHAQIDRSKQPKPGPAPKIALEVPGEFTLTNGMTILVVENRKLPRVSYNLRLNNKPFMENEIAGVSSLLGSMLGNGTANISKDDFNEEIDFLGARMNFSSNGGTASSLSKYSDRILELMADAVINPLLTQEEFEKEQDKLIDGLKAGEKSVDNVARRVGSALAYGTHHPYGEFITKETVKNVTLDNVNAYYQKLFSPNNAYLVVIGDVDFITVEKQIKETFGKWKKSIDVDTNVPEENSNLQYTQINFVDMPNAVQSNISLTNNVDLKMSDPDYHAALISNYILGGGANSYLYLNLREKHGYTYGSYSNIGNDKYASRFRAYAEVRNEVTDSSVVQLLKEINRIKTEPVNDKVLATAKAKYTGNFIMALERPQTIARYALNTKINNLPKDFYSSYLKKINVVTKEDVKRVANKYFKPENARIIVVGKGSDVIENLEKTKIPIKYFDKYANTTEKPEYSKPIPEGVTAQSIIDNYLKAVGGKDILKTIKTAHLTGNMNIEGAPMALNADIKMMVPNKESIEVSMQEMVIMKQKFDGTTGYSEQQGKKRELTQDEIKAKKSDKSLFPELYYNSTQLALESVTTIDGSDVYKIKLMKGNKPSYRYYNTDTGLLSRTESTTEVQGKTYDTVIDYDKYSAIEGVLFPYHQTTKLGPQTIIINVNNIILNEGVTDADFSQD